jgi:hypothetical protein
MLKRLCVECEKLITKIQTTVLERAALISDVFVRSVCYLFIQVFLVTQTIY